MQRASRGLKGHGAPGAQDLFNSVWLISLGASRARAWSMTLWQCSEPKRALPQHRQKEEKDSESGRHRHNAENPKERLQKGEGEMQGRQKPFDGELGQILVYTSERFRRPDRAQVHFAEMRLRSSLPGPEA